MGTASPPLAVLLPGKSLPCRSPRESLSLTVPRSRKPRPSARRAVIRGCPLSRPSMKWANFGWSGLKHKAASRIRTTSSSMTFEVYPSSGKLDRVPAHRLEMRWRSLPR